MSTYVITGTTRGIGLGLTEQLLGLPASQVSKVFVVNRRDTPALNELIQKHPDRLVAITAAVSSTEEVNKAAKEVESQLGSQGLDVLVNNAGFAQFSKDGAIGMTVDELQQSLEINLLGPQRMVNAFLPLLRAGKEKKIMNISTSMASFAFANYVMHVPVPAYKISKAAFNMYNTQLAWYLKDEGFTCLLISPGWCKTDLSGPSAELEVEEGVTATKNIILEAKQEQNGKFVNIHIPGKEESFGRYDGGEIPW